MAKKHFGKFLAATVVVGAAVAGCVAYFNKYRDFQKSLDEDFNDFEEDAEESGTEASDTTNEVNEEPKKAAVPPIKREYVSIPLDTPEKPVEQPDVSATPDASSEAEEKDIEEDFLDDEDFDIDADSSETEI